MTFARLFAVVASLHVAVIGCILMQSGCQTVPPCVTTDTVIPSDQLAPAPKVINDADVYYVPEEIRLTPTRPMWEMSAPGAAVTTTVAVGPCAPVVVSEVVASTYTVKKGDSLWSLSKRFGVSVNSLASANGISNKATLKIGQTLVIPDGSARAEVVCVSGSEVVCAKPVMIDEAGRVYKVKSGDSLSRIAKRNGTTVSALKSINGLSSDNIRVGQELLIPGKGEVIAVKASPVAVVAEPAVVTTVTPMTPPQAFVETGSASTQVDIVNTFDEQDDSFFDEDFDTVEVVPVR